jgi:DNA-directed RNA polymerase subunit omega
MTVNCKYFAAHLALRESTLARITVEDCLEHLGNRFALVVLASERARQLSKGASPLIECDNKPAVTALREIAQRRVRFVENVQETVAGYVDEAKEDDKRL